MRFVTWDKLEKELLIYMLRETTVSIAQIEHNPGYPLALGSLVADGFVQPPKILTGDFTLTEIGKKQAAVFTKELNDYIQTEVK